MIKSTKALSEKNLLNLSVKLWFIVAVIGQWIFATYVILFYGKSTVTGHLSNWNIVLPKGYISGEHIGNAIVGIHLLLAAIIIIGGPLQIIPKMRSYAPLFHKWNGRLYIFIAFIISLSGLYMVWVRGSIGGMVQHISISINAILIMVSAFLAFKYAWMRNFKKHRIWAIRLFLVVNGVWFFRVGLYFWLFINNGPLGFDPKTFEGPFLYFLTFSQYLIPLALFELYLNAQKSHNKVFVISIATILFLFTILIGIGIFAASSGIWIPKMMY
ncbi:DUF2306 domain-containing protein [Aequorivita antarctica]|uniref:DUF2306 domain-containing protein n=1 Tax=Aequorivita antarctica TaxID=153266 RepID=A0A5C6Z1B3_9FLAO|nr:DUF2306 domain-containing protein [Aequorivita antarctica]TXD73257.1 DUF2306 domain-containing protein [Aequorivita antarctica]SRX76010.1 hypothetical protein AEQU3_03008 [Aequorivita antarctica]